MRKMWMCEYDNSIYWMQVIKTDTNRISKRLEIGRKIRKWLQTQETNPSPFSSTIWLLLYIMLSFRFCDIYNVIHQAFL